MSDMLNDLMDMSSAPQELQDSCVDSFKFDSQTCDKNGDIHTRQETVETICKECENLGVVLVEGDTYVRPIVCKSCSQDGGYTARGYDFNFDVNSFYSQKVRMPNGYLIKDLDKNENYRSVERWYSHITENSQKTLLITGMPGLGKTLISNIFMLQYLKDKKEKITINSCFSTSSREILEVYNFYNTSRTTHFSTTQENSDKYSNKKKWETIKKQCKESEFLIIDEIGLNKKEEDALLDIIAHRENSNKITIYTSNLDFEKENSLKKKTLSSVLGERIESRLRKASYIRFTGKDKRKHKNTIDLKKEDIVSWKTPETIMYSLGDYTTHLMNWQVNNPIFENISPKKRNELTIIEYDNAGNKIYVDKDRPTPKIIKGLWSPYDLISITGPVPDLDDAFLYQVLLNMLALQHKNGISGIRLCYENNIEILKEFYTRYGKKKKVPDGGDIYKNLVRRLSRLKRVDITYHKNGILRWTRGLINDFDTEACWIEFNQNMIPFYNEGGYRIYNRKRLENITGYSLLIFYFLDSHKNPEFYGAKSQEFWKQLISLNRYKYKEIDGVKKSEKDVKAENRDLKKAFKPLEKVCFKENSVILNKKGVTYKMDAAYTKNRAAEINKRSK